MVFLYDYGDRIAVFKLVAWWKMRGVHLRGHCIDAKYVNLLLQTISALSKCMSD